jgi:hypothetical protein
VVTATTRGEGLIRPYGAPPPLKEEKGATNMDRPSGHTTREARSEELARRSHLDAVDHLDREQAARPSVSVWD